jgi:hypothetical protein
MNNQCFIIGGTEKAGTTSIFEYFTKHPQICSSIHKETDYFRRESVNKNEYYSLFNPPEPSNQYYMEASPAYLGLADKVIPQMLKVVADPKLVFVIRDPIARLMSSYLFHRSRLYIPENLDINSYVKMCIDFNANRIQIKDTPFTKSWFLDVLTAGAYKQHLERYLSEFKDNILLVDFEQLASHPKLVMNNICNHLNIDSSYFDNYTFFRANKTFQSKFHLIHKLGLAINNKLEPYFRKNPQIKQTLLKLYKGINSVDNIDGGKLSLLSKNALQEFYASDYDFVKHHFDQDSHNMNWPNFHD